MNLLKNTIRYILSFFGITVIKKANFDKILNDINELRIQSRKLTLLESNQSNEHKTLFIEFFEKSKSQLLQDLFVLSTLQFKENGFFIEFGAADGIKFSNSWLLEKHFHWQGILAEPARSWHKDLEKNRKSKIETKCVWSTSNETLSFSEDTVAELSTLTKFDNDSNKLKTRLDHYKVMTISLNDLLLIHNAPNEIDYLSIDTEGSEFDILNAFDFQKYKIKIITCEHNFTPQREQIFALLSQNGYKRVFEEISSFDDWYVLIN